MPTRLHFLRFEFKYVLPGDLRREVERELGYFMQLDPFVGDRADRKYFVRSLYFDGPAYAHYFEKIDGQLHRAKFRVRTYSRVADDGTPAFLELKGRHDNMVFKHRAPLNRADGSRFEVGQRCDAAGIAERTQTGDVLGRFQFAAERRNLRPAMLVDYERRPYVSKYDPEFRLTFDDHLQATHTECLFPATSAAARDVLPGLTIMEVKFRHHVPAWFHRVLQSHDLRRQSVSKICKSLEAWRLEPHMEF